MSERDEKPTLGRKLWQFIVALQRRDLHIWGRRFRLDWTHWQDHSRDLTVACTCGREFWRYR